MILELQAGRDSVAIDHHMNDQTLASFIVSFESSKEKLAAECNQLTIVNLTVINASAAATLLDQRPEKNQSLSGFSIATMNKLNFNCQLI